MKRVEFKLKNQIVMEKRDIRFKNMKTQMIVKTKMETKVLYHLMKF